MITRESGLVILLAGETIGERVTRLEQLIREKMGHAAEYPSTFFGPFKFPDMQRNCRLWSGSSAGPRSVSYQTKKVGEIDRIDVAYVDGCHGSAAPADKALGYKESMAGGAFELGQSTLLSPERVSKQC